MAFLRLNPRYQEFLEQQGLITPSRFLEIPSVIICGHPDRNVARVTLGTGATALPALLKREHRVPWKDQLLNAVAGFGFVSKSAREASLLHSLQQAGIQCPDWIAVGADNQGRAFLVLRELTQARDLRFFLQDHRHAPPHRRRQFARRLGEALAQLHNAGFDHPDLYSKHILVNVHDERISLVDWQRSQRRHRIAWRRRCRDLAALEATLHDDLATTRERLVCLAAYLQNSQVHRGERRLRLRSTALHIRRLANRFRRQRRIREICKVPAPDVSQTLIWQDGEALCLTPEFQADLAGHMPDWLRLEKLPSQPGTWEKRSCVEIANKRKALLIQRRQSSLVFGLTHLLRRRPPVSPEVRRAGLLFRLERYGICAPRLLAFGQRRTRWCQLDSFVLAELPAESVNLTEWLIRRSSDRGMCCNLIREAGRTLRRLHDVHYYLSGQAGLAVVHTDIATTKVVLANVDIVRGRPHLSQREAVRDLVALHQSLSFLVRSRTDALRLLLTYRGLSKLGKAWKPLYRALVRCETSWTIVSVLDRLAPVRRVAPGTVEQGAVP